MQYTFALSGNPNVGKTSLYNRITHSFEHVGNWHGVTVDKKVKSVTFEGDKIDLVDLPGLYSLTVYSPEEAISRDAVIKKDYDIVINVCEANNVPRNLYLTLQLLELGAPIAVVINMIDELHKRGKTIDVSKLEKALGVHVELVSAAKGFDAKQFIRNAKSWANTKIGECKLPYVSKLPIDKVRKIIGDNFIKEIPSTYCCIKALERDEYILNRLNLNDGQRAELFSLGDYREIVAGYRYEFIDKITSGIIVDDGKKSVVNKINESVMERADKLALNKILALPIFLLIMSGIIWFTFGFAGKFLSDLLSNGLDLAAVKLSEALTPVLPKWTVSLICDGIIEGVGGVLVFLPQIAILFFFLALLEDSGYISRVAFMTDGLFRRIGLSGRAVFTMIMGLGCSASAVLTARGLEDEIMRKKTVILTPFMSCSARLPVYMAVASAFFVSNVLVILGLYVLGAVTVISLAAFMQGTPLKSGETSFIMEMPRYRLPTAQRVVQIIWHNVKTFVVKVGTIVFSLSLVIWALGSFSITHGFVEIGSGESILEKLGSLIAPIFAPLGFGNWRAVTALLSGLVAKESVISTISGLGGVENVLPDSLAAICFLVYTLLYVPCIATLGAIKKEAGLRWMVLGLITQLSVAYLAALSLRTVVLAFNRSVLLGIFALGSIIAAAVIIATITKLIFEKRQVRCNGDCKNCV